MSDIVFLRKQSNPSHPRSQRVLYVVVIVYIQLYILSMEYISKFVLPIHVFASRTFGEMHLVHVPSAALHSSQPATASEHTEISI